MELSAQSTWPLGRAGATPLIIAPPHMAAWAQNVSNCLKGKVPPETIGFATSGSSGGEPKAILFSRESLEYSARAAILHMGAQSGDWCCPLPLWHIGGVMTIIRSSLAKTKVFHLPGKWDPAKYSQFMKETQAAWSSLVPAQVIDLVTRKIPAPPGIRSILVGGGTLNKETGLIARSLGWPVVQSYGMTEAGSQIATASPEDPYHTDNLKILPHWETAITDKGRLALRGKGRFFGIAVKKDTAFHLEEIAENSWWETKDIVQIHHDELTFIRRADRVIKILGELVDPDLIEKTLRHQFGHIVIDAILSPRNGYELVACHPDKTLLLKACASWNATCPGFQKIRFAAPIDIPLNNMGKIDRSSLRQLMKTHLHPL